MLQEVFECKDPKFLLEQVGPKRRYTLQVFDGTIQYGDNLADKPFFTNIQ